MTKQELTIQLASSRRALRLAEKAYETVLDGGVTEYMIGDRQATKLDAPKLLDQIHLLRKDVAELERKLAGRRGRKAFGVVPTQW